jgi:protoheme IX farnesyltransferase
MVPPTFLKCLTAIHPDPVDPTPALSGRFGGHSVSAMSTPAVAISGTRSGRERITAYVALTKPRIIELLLVTTLPTMIVAKREYPSVGLMVATLVGGALAAGGANAINMVVDRDIDKVMHRTRNRPLVTGVLAPRNALVFAIVLEVVAFGELWLLVNLLSAVLAVSATLFYVFVYTLWLKRSSSQNIVIGGAAGAVPVLVGWAAVTNNLTWTPLVMFGVIFIWTPPHFWALAFKYKDDYAAANVPMLPVVATFRRTAAEILVYTVILVGVSLLLAAVGHLGTVYVVSASVLGAIFIVMSARLWRQKTPKSAMRLFSYSITYLTLLFVAMAVDVLTRH